MEIKDLVVGFIPESRLIGFIPESRLIGFIPESRLIGFIAYRQYYAATGKHLDKQACIAVAFACLGSHLDEAAVIHALTQLRPRPQFQLKNELLGTTLVHKQYLHITQWSKRWWDQRLGK